MLWKYPLLLALGIIAGFINVIAGGGSLLTLPALMLLGLPPAVANGTNRIAILCQTVIGVSRFRKKGYFDPALGVKLAIPAVAGSLVGAMSAVRISDELFRIVLSCVMVVVMVLMIFRRPRKEAAQQKELSRARQACLMIAFFFVGLYGGFIQAGVGFVIVTTLTLLTGMTLVRINSLKLLVVGIYTVAALAVFFAHGKVDIAAGCILAVGNSTGAWLGATFAVKKGDKWIKALFIVAVAVMALKVSGLIPYTSVPITSTQCIQP